ncbi:XRE family transcriptional regulator [Pseudomonas aeruginosa]|nr:XRE family transcriptional regulator [Pseudomonas aeruginosa]EKW4490541.1 XRE family transcriptional regulator [Pseudomonas aeruginosa]EKY0078120.1 XRE family transcriptional regulator [Pseudomonas aeruginosa]EKY1848024.1 XRE family transcriptional regulator [Pseudomonas aeruginosa]ELN4432139.1 XRE family transcriptional regulator [Pseudomonas aeruginosa]
MSNVNLFELLSNDPVQFNMQNLKSNLLIVIINLIREKGWNQASAAKELEVSQPRMSNLFKGQLNKFSTDTLLEMLVRLNYNIDVDFDPDNKKEPLALKLKKRRR